MNRIKYIDGFRGLATLVVLFNHFAGLFYPTMFSYSADKAHASMELFFSTTPLFALINGQGAVIIFFMLSGYLLSCKYFIKKDRDILISTAIRRYFRLLPPCLLSILVGYLLIKYSLTSADQVYSEYILWKFNPSLSDAIREGFYGIFTGTSSSYNIALWTIAYEIKGTYLVLAILSLLGNYRKRYIVYFLSILIFRNSFFAAFIIGLLLSDLKINKEHILKSINKPLINVVLLLAGLMLTIYPVTFTNHNYMYGIMQKLSGNNELVYRIIGASMIFLVVLNSALIQRFLNLRALTKIGEVSFSIYVIHLAIMGSISSSLFLYINRYLTYNISAVISIIISSIFIYIIAKLMHKYIDYNGVKLSNTIYIKFFNNI